jgi:hypothetical protein
MTRPVTDLSYEDKSFIERPVDLSLNLVKPRAITFLARGLCKPLHIPRVGSILAQFTFFLARKFK